MRKKGNFYENIPKIRGNPQIINGTENPKDVLFGEKPLNAPKAEREYPNNGTEAERKRDGNVPKAGRKRDRRQRFTATKEVEKILSAVEKKSDYVNRAIVIFARKEVKKNKNV